MIRWILALVLVVTLAPIAEPQRSRESRQRKLQSELRDVQRQKARAQRQLQITRRAARAVTADLVVVDNRLNELEDALDRTTSRLSQSRNEQERLALELQAATQRLDIRREQVRQRLRRMYIRGEASYLSALAGSATTGDLASRKFLQDRIARADRELFEDFVSLREGVAVKLNRQRSLTQEIGSLVNEQRGQQDNLEETKEEKRQTLAQLRSKTRELQQMLRQFEADEASIAAQIAAFRPRPGQALTPFTGRFRRPVNGPITSGFGMRMHPVLRIRRLHAGVDFGARTGTPIMAAADGQVITATYMRGYGNTVILAHGSGITTVYAHCSRLLVSAGQRVRQGEVIARVGSTGLSTGPHLHFEIRVNGRPVNPLGRL